MKKKKAEKLIIAYLPNYPGEGGRGFAGYMSTHLKINILSNLPRSTDTDLDIHKYLSTV